MALAVEPLTGDQTRLGELALAAGWIDPPALEACLARAAATGLPLGAALVDADLLTPQQLGALLIDQQRRRRTVGFAAPRLTEREHRLLGLWLVDQDLVDIDAIVACREAQVAALRAGRHRLLGEIVLESELIPPGRLDSMLACLSSPQDVERRFEHQPARRRLLELYLAPPDLDSAERFAVRVVRAPRPEDLDRAHVLREGVPTLVGRAVDEGVALLDPRVSTPHCQLRLLDGVLEIRDLGSKNGTFVAGNRVAETRLVPGQRVEVGDCQLEFVVAGSGSSDESTVDSVMSELNESLEVIKLERDHDGEEPLAIAATRAIFREFHARRAQVEAIENVGTRVEQLPSLRPGPAATTAIEPVRTRSARGVIASTVAVLAVALLGFVASLRAPLPGRTEPDRRPRVQRSVPYEVPAPAATRPAPGVGKRIQIYGTALRWRWLRAGDRVTFSGAIVGGGDDARTLLVQGPRAVLREATADGRPLADGTKLRVYGTLRTFDGPPARLPDGSKTRLYVDVERVELYN